VLLRLALRPDRALLVAALGTAAAILLPVASTLVLAGVTAHRSEGWIAYPSDPDGSLRLDGGPSPTLVLAVSLANASRAAYVVGDPIVAPGARLGMPFSAVKPRSDHLLPLVGDDLVLVHPDDLGPSRVTAALFDHQPVVAGATVAPARGADAFEQATTDALRSQGLALIALSVPAVCLVAYAFARQEVRSQARRAATLSALGGHRLALAILSGRMLLMAAVAGAVAAAVGAGLYYAGPSLFHPADAPKLRLAAALLVPTVAAAAGGMVAVWRGAADPNAALRGPGRDVEDDVSVRLPLAVRPLLVGLRLLPVLLLASALFVVDVGFPAAAARTPASLAGGPGEWVVGVENGLVIGAGTNASVADVAGLDPRVEAIVAESIIPTLLGSHPVVLRGGNWTALADYHALGLGEGRAPRADEVVLGSRAAARYGWHIGDRLVVQGSARPEARVIRVSGVAQAAGPESDEGFVSQETGRELASLLPGQANVIRFRPETQEARAAVTQVPANLVVTGVRVDPPGPAAGSVATVLVDVANLGASAGSRTLTVRLNGDPLVTRDVPLGPHAKTRLLVPFVVPAGPLVTEVNPTSSDEASSSELVWTQEGTAVAGSSVTFTLRRNETAAAGVRAALYATIGDAQADGHPLQAATTDGAGQVQFVLDSDFVVATVDQPRAFIAGRVLSASGGAAVVTDVWTVPGIVPVATPATMFGRLRNPSAAAVDGEVPAYVGAVKIGSAPYHLGPGESATVAFPLYFLEPVANVTIGDHVLALTRPSAAAQGAGPAPSLPIAGVPEARPGTGVQTQVAARVLGDARQALVGLGGCALASTLAVVYLATRRTLVGRRHVVGLLEALGQGRDRIRGRAAFEGAVLGGFSLAALLLPVKLAFQAMAAWGPPVFAHALPDPIGWVFALQATAAFAAACAWAGYLAAAAPGQA
jgi:hypothetical protein